MRLRSIVAVCVAGIVLSVAAPPAHAYSQMTYWLKEGARKGGPVEIGRNYANLFVKRGGTKLYEDLDASGGIHGR